MARGRLSSLGDAQREQLCRALLRHPTKHDFDTELWTLKCVRLLIEQRFGVSYNEAHIWRILDSLGF